MSNIRTNKLSKWHNERRQPKKGLAWKKSLCVICHAVLDVRVCVCESFSVNNQHRSSQSIIY